MVFIDKDFRNSVLKQYYTQINKSVIFVEEVIRIVLSYISVTMIMVSSLTFLAIIEKRITRDKH